MAGSSTPSFDLVWAQHAHDQVNSLAPAAKRVVMTAVAEIQHDPFGRGVYDKTTDRYTADFADDGVAGLIVYVLGEQQLRIVVLRVTVID